MTTVQFKERMLKALQCLYIQVPESVAKDVGSAVMQYVEQLENSGDYCLICQKWVPDYIPERCCNGSDCGCMGQPVNPCVCSKRCSDALSNGIGKPMDQRRINAGIELVGPDKGELWNAVNDYAKSCGGDTGPRTISPSRMDAVVAVERAVYGKH